MENFLLKKDESSIIWPHFKKWFENLIARVPENKDEYFGYIDGKYVTSPTLGSFGNRSFLISLELWNLFYYSFNPFPKRFFVQCDEAHPDWESFKNWFVKESNIFLGNIKWNYLGKDDSTGGFGFNVCQTVAEFRHPITLVDITTWKTARYSRINFDDPPKIKTNSFKIGDVVCENFDQVKIVTSIENGSYYDEYDILIEEENVIPLTQDDLISAHDLSEKQLDIVLSIIQEFKNINSEI